MSIAHCSAAIFSLVFLTVDIQFSDLKHQLLKCLAKRAHLTGFYCGVTFLPLYILTLVIQ